MIAGQEPRVTVSLRIDGQHVRVSQVLLLPIPPGRVAELTARLQDLDAADLSDQYADFVQQWTHRLIHVARHGTRLTLSLTRRGPVLLRLRLEDNALEQATRVVARLTIIGGLAAVPSIQEGSLILRLAVREREQPGALLEAEVLVENYAPLLLALPLPGTLRTRLYRATQARIHRAVTSAFLWKIVGRTMG
ncbi:MAG TPA: hypothetical protein DEV93_06495 [Chloroflexi bacterium]|nr:hypothetical protein [Chloroflexota bacterium]